jgi:hypothetical protein
MLDELFFAFCSTIYVGTMWCVRLFFYPTWKAMTPASVWDHFIIPTRAATRLFTVVIPLMFVAGTITIIEEWGHAQLWQAIVSVGGISASALFATIFIIPLNKRVAAGVAADAVGPVRLDQSSLDAILGRWMKLNEVRVVLTTVTWVAVMWLLVGKGDLSRLFGR